MMIHRLIIRTLGLELVEIPLEYWIEFVTLELLEVRFLKT